MKNIVFSTKNIDEVISDIANEVIKRLNRINYSQKLPEEPQEKLLSVEEAAKFLNLTVPTIYTKVSKGELPYMKRSRKLYFSNLELLNYVKKGRNKTILELEQEAEKFLSKK